MRIPAVEIAHSDFDFVVGHLLSEIVQESLLAQVVDATPSELKALLTGGVYDRTEAKRAFCGAESRAVESLEGGPVAA